MQESASPGARRRRISTVGNGHAPSRVTDPSGQELLPKISPAPSEQLPQGPQPEKQPTPNDLYGEIRALIFGDNPGQKRAEISSKVTQLLKTVIAPHDVRSKYNWLIIHDTIRMVRGDTDSIYAAINNFSEKKEIGLIITSSGGHIEPAYLISKLCREASPGRFIAVVPRRAKSGATLVACGADEIHMGQMSELGPIDPQFDNLPALGLKNAVQHLAELASKYPNAAEMFASYLTKSLKLVNLGHYERVAESAMQYAVRLLNKRTVPVKGNADVIARQLVYGYMDHGFVIDQTEATEIFGADVIKTKTDEYNLGNSVYEWLSYLESLFETAKYSFYMYGSVESDCAFFPNRQ